MHTAILTKLGLGLPKHLEALLNPHLREGEEIGRNKYGVVIGEMNYTILLPRWQKEQVKRKWVIKKLRNKRTNNKFYLPNELIEKIEQYSNLHKVVFSDHIEQRNI